MIRRNERATARAERRILWNEQAITKAEEKVRAAKTAEDKVLAARELSKVKNFCEHGKRRRGCRTCGGIKVWARSLLIAAKTRAKADGIPCELDIPWIVERLKLGCPVFKFPFCSTNSNRGDRSTSATIDKFRPAIGYTKENAFVISFFANSIKQNATADQVFAVANWMRSVEAQMGLN